MSTAICFIVSFLFARRRRAPFRQFARRVHTSTFAGFARLFE